MSGLTVVMFLEKINSSGSATYTIPIQIPPGVAGMVPRLALTYSSQRGNGMLGMGWALSGLSSISRCAASRAQDGVAGAVNFDTNDKFCLDGQKLMQVPGTGAYGAAGSEYRTEIDGFSHIIANGAAGAGPSSFTVKTKSGLTMEYGNTPDSRIEAVKSTPNAQWATGTVRAWAHSKSTDRSGNYLTATYDEDTVNGTYYPSRIDYTGNASSSPALAPSASVQFVTDTTRLDAIADYLGGAVLKSTKREKAIRTYVGTALVKEYRLAFGAQGGSPDRSKLASITECDGVGVCQSPVSLAWGSAGSDGFSAINPWLNAQYGSGTWTDNNVYPRTLVDVNGDGLPDIVGFGPQGVYVALNTGSGFSTPSIWLDGAFSPTQGWVNNQITPRMLVDVNGDGLPDIVGFGEFGLTVALNTGIGFTLQGPFSANYTCAAGATLSGSTCTTTSTDAGTPAYNCTVGGVFSDSTCPYGSKGVATVPATRIGTICLAGYTSYGLSCVKTSSSTANLVCPP